MTRTRMAAAAATAALSTLLLTACAGAQQAVDQAQGLVDQTQSLVDSAASIASAPDAIGAACTTALEGTVPGTPIVDARAAVTAAAQQIDETLGVAGSLPIVSDFRDALVNATESLVADGSAASLAAARQAISGVCGITQ